jgi:hypothetical protein
VQSVKTTDRHHAALGQLLKRQIAQMSDKFQLSWSAGGNARFECR